MRKQILIQGIHLKGDCHTRYIKPEVPDMEPGNVDSATCLLSDEPEDKRPDCPQVLDMEAQRADSSAWRSADGEKSLGPVEPATRVTSPPSCPPSLPAAFSLGLLMLLLLVIQQPEVPLLLLARHPVRQQSPIIASDVVTSSLESVSYDQKSSTGNTTSSTGTFHSSAGPMTSSTPAVYVPVQGGCMPDPVISAHSEGGRLGNTMAEYATIFALGLRYNITAVVPRSLLYLMRRAFLNLTLPVVFEYCLLDDQMATAEMFEEVPDDEKHAHSWEIVHYAHRISLFWKYRELLKREFTFRPDLAAGAQKQLKDVAGNRTHLTFIGVHVRRNDYAHHLWVMFGGYMLNASFYLGAMDLCRSRYHQPVFIVTSDDLDWCREHLSAPDVYVIGDPRRMSPGVERDMALMAACNHTVFDYGTFGFFGAFLAGGDLITADGYAKKEHEIVSELRIGSINATFLDPKGNLLPGCLMCTTTNRSTVLSSETPTPLNET